MGGETQAEVQIGDDVIIPTGQKGTVCGKWVGSDMSIRWAVRYVDGAQVRREDWFVSSELRLSS